MKKNIFVFAFIAISSLLSACSMTQEQSKEEAPVGVEPATITLFSDSGTLSDDYRDKIIESVKAKMPNLTLQFITGKSLDEYMSAQETPDIIYTYWTRMGLYKNKDILEDLTPLLRKINFDLSRIDPKYLNDVRKLSDKGELYAIPYYTNFQALYYNKDIFDKFGVPYPSDGMTWDEILELAKKVTRSDNGIQYKGLEPSSLQWISLQRGITVLDGQTDKPTLSSPEWKKTMEFMKAIYSIPGNERIVKDSNFIKNRNVAMLIYPNQLEQLSKPDLADMNWDVVQFPSLPENPGIYPALSVHSMLISKTSKHKDQALQVIDIVTSPEVQLWLSQNAKGSILRNPDIQKSFGLTYPQLKDKNLQGIFKSQPMGMPVNSPYEVSAFGLLNKLANDYFDNKIDLNTMIRTAEEAITKYVATEKANK